MAANPKLLLIWDLLPPDGPRTRRAFELLDQTDILYQNGAMWAVVCSGENCYEVRIRDLLQKDWRCDCKDFEFHGHEGPCKHIRATLIKAATLASPEGPGGVFEMEDITACRPWPKYALGGIR